MPRLPAAELKNGIHISKVDMIVEGDNPPIAEMGGGGAADRGGPRPWQS